MKREEYIDIVKGLLLTSAKKSLMSFLIKKIPCIALPVISPIVGAIVGWILSIILDETELRVSYLYTDFRVGQQGRDFTEKADLFKQGKIDEKELIDSFRSFVKLSV